MEDNLEILAERYAQGLYESAQENSALDKLMKEFNSLDELWQADANFRIFFPHELITRSEKKSVVEKLVGSDSGDAILLNFLKVIIDNHRSELLHQIFLKFRKLYDEGKNIQRVVIESARALTAIQKKQFQKALHVRLGKDALLEERIKPELLSGVHIRYGNIMFDNSLQAKLEGLKEVLT